MKKYLLLWVMLLPLSLSGCVAAAVVAAAAVGGAGTAVVMDKRSFRTMQNDHNAQDYAQRLINQSPSLKGKTHITVTVFNGVALLTGQAPTPAMRLRAYRLTKGVKNIHTIYNEIVIAGPSSLSQRSSDSWLTAKVRSAFVAKSGLRSNDLKVVTEQSIVYIMGHVSRSQANLAVDAARRVSGVSKVVKVFQYTK